MAKGECPECGAVVVVTTVKNMRRYKCPGCKSNGYLGKASGPAGETPGGVPVPEVSSVEIEPAKPAEPAGDGGNGGKREHSSIFFDVYDF